MIEVIRVIIAVLLTFLVGKAIKLSTKIIFGVICFAIIWTALGRLWM